MDAQQTGEPTEHRVTPHEERIAAWVNRVADMCADIRDDAGDDEDLGVIEDELFSALSKIEKRLNFQAAWRKKRRDGNG